ncbi:hypothetical protein BASA60_002597 [Batrachochytrium salamandrivorans]|nr:hypothetical protein BASA60_002597 [Batrachochytrium salamandrivorans]
MSSNSPTTVEPANNIGDMDGSNEAESVQCPVFWTTDYDMKKRTWGDWMAAHTSFMYPLHHYIGTATLQGDRLTLSGHHKSERNMHKGTATNASLVGGVAEEKTTSSVTVVVHRLRAKSVTQGFDSIFRRIDDRGVGLYMPVILVYDDQDDSSVISAIVSSISRNMPCHYNSSKQKCQTLITLSQLPKLYRPEHSILGFG